MTLRAGVSSLEKPPWPVQGTELGATVAVNWVGLSVINSQCSSKDLSSRHSSVTHWPSELASPQS